MRISPLKLTINGCTMKVMLKDVTKFELFTIEEGGTRSRGYAMSNVVENSQHLEEISDPIFRIVVSTLAMLRNNNSVGGLSIEINKYESPIPFEEMLPTLIIKAYEKFYEFEL